MLLGVISQTAEIPEHFQPNDFTVFQSHHYNFFFRLTKQKLDSFFVITVLNI